MGTDSMYHEGTKNTTEEWKKVPNATPLRGFVVNSLRKVAKEKLGFLLRGLRGFAVK